MNKPSHITVTGVQVDLATHIMDGPIESLPMLLSVTSIDQVISCGLNDDLPTTIYLKKDTKRITPIYVEESVTGVGNKINPAAYTDGQ